MDIEELFRGVGLNAADCDDLHISRMLHGFVAVSHGLVVKVTEPRLRFCPLVVPAHAGSGQVSEPANAQRSKEERFSC